jgi:hypothetical protein
MNMYRKGIINWRNICRTQIIDSKMQGNKNILWDEQVVCLFFCPSLAQAAIEAPTVILVLPLLKGNF